MSHVCMVLLLSALGAGPAPESAAANDLFQASRLPDLPNAQGVAGAYAGTSGGVLIVAGGANFPEKMPWEGGAKAWHDAIYVLPQPSGAWQTCPVRLPRPLAYGVSVSSSEGVFCLGGGDAKQHYADAFVLHWRDGQMTRTELPPLPRPVAFACGAMVKKTIYVAGGRGRPDASKTLKTFWALDVSGPRESWKWRELPPWPGRGRMLAVAGAQDDSFFLIGGVDLVMDPVVGKPRCVWLDEAYRYTPPRPDQTDGLWRKITPPPRPVAASPSPAVPLGQTQLAMLSGDDGSHWDFSARSDHPGFPKDVLVYCAVTDRWTMMGNVPESRVATPVVAWRGGFVVPSGEVRAGVRSPAVDFLKVGGRRAPFGVLNYLALLAYLIGMVILGVWFARRNKTTDDFFRGGQRIPWWAAGLSIYATLLSSITYMAVPGKVFATDWCYIFNSVAILLVAPIVVTFYLPFFRRLDVTSAYEYLEKRFNLFARWFASISFMLLQLGRAAIVLYLPALALATVSSMDVYVCILLMSVLCILYTVFGGMEAVVWTDVAQTIILLAGAIFAIVFILMRTDGGLVGMVRMAHANGKFFENVRWTWDTTAATVLVVLVGGVMSNIANYTSSQDVVQRYVTTKNHRDAARSIWMNALMAIPSGALFFAVGTALFVFYRTHPQQYDPRLPTDAVFPLFIVQELPAGLGGLVIAGIFAAAQSTLAGSLNSMATCWITDFHRRLRPGMSDRDYLRLARGITVVAGIGVTAVACVMAHIGVSSLWDSFLTILGLTTAAMGGLFALGIFTTRANGPGALCGAATSVVVLYFVTRYTHVHFYLYSAIGMVVCFVVGWLASWCIGSPPSNLAGLTRATQE